MAEALAISLLTSTVSFLLPLMFECQVCAWSNGVVRCGAVWCASSCGVVRIKRRSGRTYALAAHSDGLTSTVPLLLPLVCASARLWEGKDSPCCLLPTLVYSAHLHGS